MPQAAGAGLRQEANIARMRLEDVAPLIGALLGLSFAVPDGVLQPGLLTDAS